jgi:hypothetical protein
MSPRSAQIIFIVFNILAIPVVGFAVYDFIYVKSAIANGEHQIPFDSGTYYFLLGTLFWLLLIIQIIGKKNHESPLLKFGNQIVITWFIGILILANLIPYYLQQTFVDAGYVKCDDPAEINRIARGESSIYVKGSCKDIGDGSDQAKLQ